MHIHQQQRQIEDVLVLETCVCWQYPYRSE